MERHILKINNSPTIPRYKKYTHGLLIEEMWTEKKM